MTYNRPNQSNRPKPIQPTQAGIYRSDNRTDAGPAPSSKQYQRSSCEVFQGPGDKPYTNPKIDTKPTNQTHRYTNDLGVVNAYLGADVFGFLNGHKVHQGIVCVCTGKVVKPTETGLTLPLYPDSPDSPFDKSQLSDAGKRSFNN
jgi:hypothetical protein